jgi:hypothetical protein
MPLPPNRLALAVGDASGNGLAAALMISNVQSSLRTAAAFTGHHGPAVLTAVNRQVYASSLEGRFATLFYGVFDGATRRLHYVNFGDSLLPTRRQPGIEHSLWPTQQDQFPIGVPPSEFTCARDAVRGGFRHGSWLQVESSAAWSVGENGVESTACPRSALYTHRPTLGFYDAFCKG